MEVDAAREFIRENHRAVLVTYRRDGSPQLSPVLVNVDTEGRVELSSNEPRAKVRNLRRNPRVSACVFTNGFFGGRWVQIDGTAELVGMPEAMEELIAYERRMSGDREDWDGYRRSAAEQRAVIVKIAIERAGPS